MRVLHLITPSHVGGAELLVLGIARTQMQQGHVVRVLTKPHAAYESRARKEGVDCVAVPISGKFNVRALRVLREAILQFKPDLVCTHLSSATLWGALAARWCHIPCVAMVHGFNTALCYRFAPLLVCVSEAVAAHMERQGLPRERLRVVHNGIDPAPFEEGPVAELGDVPSEAFCVGAAAHLSPKKGFAELVEVALQLETAHFVIAGEGRMRPWLEEMARGPLKGRLHLLGFWEDMPALMRRFTVFCLPSQREPFGLVVLEAMAAGKPVVAFRAGGVPEIVIEGETGLLAPAGDVQAMVECLRRLQQDSALCRRLGTAGKERVGCCFTMDRAFANLQRVFDEAVACHKAGTAVCE